MTFMFPTSNIQQVSTEQGCDNVQTAVGYSQWARTSAVRRHKLPVCIAPLRLNVSLTQPCTIPMLRPASFALERSPGKPAQLLLVLPRPHSTERPIPDASPRTLLCSPPSAPVTSDATSLQNVFRDASTPSPPVYAVRYRS